MSQLEINITKILSTYDGLIIKKREIDKEINLELSNPQLKEGLISKLPSIFLRSYFEIALTTKDIESENRVGDGQKIFFELFLEFLASKRIDEKKIEKWYDTISMYYYDSNIDFLKEVDNKFKIATEIEKIGYSDVAKKFIDIVFKNVQAKNINKSEEEIKEILIPLKNSNELLFKYLIAPLSVDNFGNSSQNLYHFFYNDYDSYLIQGLLDNKIKLKNGKFSNGLIDNYTHILKKCIIEDSDNLNKTSHIVQSLNYLNIDIMDLVRYAHETSDEKAKNLILKISENFFKFNENNKMDLISSWLYAKENSLLYKKHESKRKKDIRKDLYIEGDYNLKIVINFCFDGIRNDDTANGILINIVTNMSNSTTNNVDLYEKFEKVVKKLVSYLNKNPLEKEIFNKNLDKYRESVNKDSDYKKEKDKIELLITLMDKHDILDVIVANNKIKNKKLKF